MNTSKIIDLAYISDIPDLPKNFVKRDSIVDQIEKMAQQYDVIFIDGDPGVGKTTILTDFVKDKTNRAISAFVNPNYKYSYSYDCIIDIIYRQMYFLCNNDIVSDEIIVDINLFNSIQGNLFRKIKELRKKGEILYFIFDGFEHLKNKDIETLISVFESLPWKESKFIFTGKMNLFSIFLKDRKFTSYSIPISNFGISETKEYFKDLSEIQSEITEIHRLSEKGLPSKLKEIKFLCESHGGVKSFFESENTNSEKTNFLETIWQEIDKEDKFLIKIISLIVFCDIELEVATIAEILESNSELIVSRLGEISFIEVNQNKVEFKLETLRSYLKHKLSISESEITSLLIEYYEKYQGEEESKYNLSDLYSKAKNWEKLTTFLSVDRFIYLLEKFQSMGNIRSQFNVGFEASKNYNTEFSEARLRFALHKSSVKDLEINNLWENEIEARIKLEDHNHAIQLANSAFLKEDRLKLLAIIAKQLKINKNVEDAILADQIKSLYQQIDFSIIREKGFEIAAILLYTNLEMAIELVERVTDNSSKDNSLDQAYAYLMLYATNINKKAKSQIADIDIIDAKIKDNEIKNITKALRFLSEEFAADDFITYINNITKFSQKLFLLKNWISNNKENEEVSKIIKFTLDEIVNNSREYVPNSTILSEIAQPLPYISNIITTEQLISSFDIHRQTADRPTRDYIDLQITIAEALLKIDHNKATDRIYDIYLLIDEISDLSIKTDCLCILWHFLCKHDKSHVIEKSLSSNFTIEAQIEKNINLLLKDTALHFKVLEFIIAVMTGENPDFVYDIIQKLNTQERKDVAFMVSIETYMRNKKLDEINFNLINTFKSKIKSIHLKEQVVFEIIEKFHGEIDSANLYSEQLTKCIEESLEFKNDSIRCPAFVSLINILSIEKTLNEASINVLIIELHNSWSKIDNLWDKIDAGFIIANTLTIDFKEIAIDYLRDATLLKQQETFSSYNVASTYVKSASLSIRAFSGLVGLYDDLTIPLGKLGDQINQLNSIGESLKLWSEVHLRLIARKKNDLAEIIVSKYVKPLLNDWGLEITNSYRSEIISHISPSLFKYNFNYFKEYFFKLNEHYRNISVRNVCNFILTNLPLDEPTGEKQIFSTKLDYSDINDACLIIELASDDFLIYYTIQSIVKSISENKGNLTKEQKSSIKQKLKIIIANQLPTLNGIQHEGYKILCEAELQTLETYEESVWNNLIARANNITNLSDKALIFAALAELINHKTNKKKTQLIESAYTCIKSIPSIFDKTNRLEGMWQILANLEKGLFVKYIKLAFTDLLSYKDGEISGIKNIIDIAHKYDSRLAQEFVTILDQDPARKRLKAPLVRRLEGKNKINDACKKNRSYRKT
jgi:hypothetical protein